MLTYSRSLGRLIEALQALPGIGVKSAERVAMFILANPPELARDLAGAITQAREGVRACQVCFNYSDKEICPICEDPSRDRSTLCVVENTRNLAAVERSKQFRGVYHVLQGLINPLEGKGPEDVRIAELVERVRKGGIQEVIIATNPVLEGDTTAHYLAEVIKPLQVRVTRLGLGLPVGADLDYADQLTLSMALEGRREM